MHTLVSKRCTLRLKAIAIFLSQHASHLTRFHLSIGFLVLKERNTVTNNASNLFPACIMPRHTFVFARQIPRWINLNSHVLETRSRVKYRNFQRFSGNLDRIQTFRFQLAWISRRIKFRFSSYSKNSVYNKNSGLWLDRGELIFEGVSFFCSRSIRITVLRLSSLVNVNGNEPLGESDF